MKRVMARHTVLRWHATCWRAAMRPGRAAPGAAAHSPFHPSAGAAPGAGESLLGWYVRLELRAGLDGHRRRIRRGGYLSRKAAHPPGPGAFGVV